MARQEREAVGMGDAASQNEECEVDYGKRAGVLRCLAGTGGRERNASGQLQGPRGQDHTATLLLQPIFADEEPFGHDDDMEMVFFFVGRLRMEPQMLVVQSFHLNCSIYE